MRILLFILFFFTLTNSFATVYYISPTGNNSNNGTSPATAWQTITGTGLNTKWSSVPINGGDQILFERGQTFFGNIIITRSGSVGNPITIGSYGSGALPVIHTYTTLTGWTNDGGGIWHKNVPNAKNSLINVAIDNNMQQIGRFPNTNASQGGYLTYTASNNNSTPRTITTASNSSVTNWVGAEVVIRKNHFNLDRCNVTGHSGLVVQYTNTAGTNIRAKNGGYGYFFQNDIRTLDQFGEWYLNTSTKNLSVYFGANNPASYTIKASTFDTVINCGNQGYITITNVAVEGANGFGIAGRNGSNITVTNCVLNNNYDAISIKGTNTVTITGNIITNVHNNGIAVTSSGTCVISSNILKRISLRSGMGTSGDGTYGCIEQTGDNATLQYNVIDSIGYCGIISGQHNNILVRYNYILNHCFTKDDGGGIYTARGLDAYHVNEVNRTISFNIIGRGIGATNGTPNFAAPGTTYDAHGVYADASAKNLYVYNNSTFNHANGTGMFINGDTAITTRNHTSYLDHYGLKIERLGDTTTQQSRNRFIIHANNISYPTTTNISFFNQVPDEPVPTTNQQDIRDIFTRIDSNFYRNTVSKPFFWFTDNPPESQTMAFAAWVPFINQESHSQVITTATPTRFEYNATNAPSTVSLGAIYTDVRGNQYSGAITLQPFTSALLFFFGPLGGNVPPNANAGPDQTITLPDNDVVLTGSGTDSDGTIVSYSWLKIFGPAPGTVSSPNSATTNVINLVQGTYQFQLTVTDNNGATDKDTVQIVVVANQNPSANAGPDRVITLPTNNTTANGSGSDPDGTIASYAWVQLAGPNTATLGTPNAATTTVTGLIAGTYNLQLTVTDNGGLTGTDIMQITVNPQPNVVPNADAGVDQSITLPTSTATLNGNGSTDPDGTISTYAWVKISGPTGGTITNPSAALTGVTALQQGTYVFQLTVTDNGGLQDSDVMQIIVNPAANVAPTANAGVDQTITLPTSTTSVSGSGSTDPDGTITGYAWTKISGPSGGNITTPTTVSTNITALQQGTYVFRLIVTDNGGLTNSDFMQIIVNAANIAPTANAGIDQSITLPTSTTTLTGSGTDPDGTISTYAWLKISGPTGGTITSPSSATSGVTALQQGTYVFQLTVTDNGGLTGTDFMQVVVSPANIAPTANAGSDQVITLPTNTTTLVGSGSDPDGTIASYGWLKISGPSGGTVSNPTSSTTGITGLQQGTYVYQLTVTDDDGLTGTDFMQIVVNAANVAPTANAGIDQSITLPTNTATLSGSGTDPDGTIVGYLWTKISGPAGGAITSSTSASTGVTALQQGTYVFSLTVTDNQGLTGTDFMQIVVNPAIPPPNIPPTVDAGANQTVTLPTSTATLTGTASDPDGTISSVLWTKISGPTGGAITSPTTLSTGITGLVAGTYTYQLRATDNSGDTATDAMQITVNAANIAPTANAGPDQSITLPTSTTTLLGSGTDPDGTIAGYFWTKISGPAGGTINSPSNATTNISSLGSGVYIFQLRVTDNKGDTAIDAVQVTVNAANIAPTANAGADQFITLPTSTTSLVGSGSDPDGTIAAYLWTKLSGPTGGTIATPTTASTNISALQQGVYVFQLRVTDNVGDTATDAVQVTVNAANIAPTANAGVNQTITLPTNSTTLVGSGTDPDGTISAYLWTQISGTGGTIVSPTASTTDITGLSQGVYIYQLRVTDNAGDTATDAIQITVNAAPLLPVANAGADQIMTLPTVITNLEGSGTDADGTIVSYLWTQIGGPATATIYFPNQDTTQVGVDSIVGGTYVFLLTVTDNDGDTASDVMQITVNLPPPNINPIANAGGDKVITLPTNTVTLTGSGTDEDGTVVSYYWTGTNGAIISPNSSTTVVNNLTQGIHTFTLTVTDDRGGTGTDIMQVTVHENIVISTFPLKGYKVISN